MGFAIAAAAAAAGHRVLLVAGPVSLATPVGVERVDVVTAEEMAEAVRAALPDMEAVVCCAAVADYRPVQVAEQKIKKGAVRMTLELERTTDILGSVRRPWGWGGVLVGFAAETERLLEHARRKLELKGCDLVVANDVSGVETGFESDENAAWLLYGDGRVEEQGRQPKSELAAVIVARVQALHGAARTG
jgi:phosphopantothenoylcysteine synthetase/decarboxylase